MQKLCSESTTFQEPLRSPGLGGSSQLVYKNMSFGYSSTHLLAHDDISVLNGSVLNGSVLNGSVLNGSVLKELPASKELIKIYDSNVNLMKSTFFEEDLPPELVHPTDDSGSTEAIMEQYLDISARSSPMTTITEPEIEIIPPDELPTPNLYEIGAFQDVPIMFSRNYIDLAIYHNKSFKVGWKKGKTFLMYHNEFEPPEIVEVEDLSEDPPDRCRKINILELDNTNYNVKITPAQVCSAVNYIRLTNY